MYDFKKRPSGAAVVGIVAVGVAIALSSFTIVRAERANPDKRMTYRCSTGTACVEGSSTGSSTWGVYGTSVSADGIHGVTSATNGNSGTSGISTATTGSAHGVYGRSSNGQGVYGTSSSNNGVEGHSTGSGSSGVAGIQRGTSSGSGDGVYSESADKTNFYEALEAKADSSNTYIFEGFNASTNGLCTIDYNAALACTGGAVVKNVRTRHTNAIGQHVLAYAAESATATIEDVGTARMVGGVANVAIDPAFAAVMDRQLVLRLPYPARRHTRPLCERKECIGLPGARKRRRTFEARVRLPHRCASAGREERPTPLSPSYENAAGRYASGRRQLDPFDCRKPGRRAVVVVESRPNAVRFDGDDIPPIARVKRRS